MPTPSPHSVEVQSEAEALFLEQALAYYRDMKTAAKNAPYGRFLDQAETVAVLQGRELLRQSLQAVAQEEIDDIEKKTKRRSAKPVKRKNDTEDIETKTS